MVVFYAPETLRDIKFHYIWLYECMKSGLMYRRGYDFILDRQTKAFLTTSRTVGRQMNRV